MVVWHVGLPNNETYVISIMVMITCHLYWDYILENRCQVYFRLLVEIPWVWFHWYIVGLSIVVMDTYDILFIYFLLGLSLGLG